MFFESQRRTKMDKKTLGRRDFLRMGALTTAGVVLAGCGPAPTPEVIREQVEVTRIVEKEGETVVETVIEEVEVVLTATPPPAEAATVHFTGNLAAEIYDPMLFDLVDERTEGIILEMDVTPFGNGWDQYSDNLVTRIAGGEGIDLLHTAIEGLAFLSENNVLASLDSFIDADAEFKADLDEDVHPKLLEGLQWKGVQRMLPNGCNNMVMHYNYKIFEEKGVAEPDRDWSWEDFVDTCLAVADVQGTEDDLYAYSFWDATFGMAPWYYNNDTAPLTDDWLNSNMLDPKVAETLQFLHDLIHEYKVAPDPAGWDEWGQFHSGHQAMRGCGGWCISGAKNAEFYDFKMQYYPHRAGPLKAPYGVEGEGMTTMSAHPDAAWEVLKLLNGPEISMNMLLLQGSPQSRRSVMESDTFMNHAQPSPADMSIFWESFDYGKLLQAPINYSVVDPLLVRWYSKLWNNELTVDEVVVGCHEELQAEMDILKNSLMGG
jgi:multiple sugar transport system substrate-binding protein